MFSPEIKEKSRDFQKPIKAKKQPNETKKHNGNINNTQESESTGTQQGIGSKKKKKRKEEKEKKSDESKNAKNEPTKAKQKQPESSRPLAIRVGEGKYNLGAKVGSGSFGVIHEGMSISGEEKKIMVAVKLEKASSKYPQLQFEYKIYRSMKSSIGVPKVYWYGKEGEYNILIMEMLGPSLEDLFIYCGRQFSLKTVLLLADQMIERIQKVHTHKFIHRDIKPDNFLIGLEENFNIVYVIDFGLAKRYIITKTKQHIPMIKGKSLTGTARYASVNTHLGYEQSRRDDLETLGYVLLYFMCKGKLPWQGLKAKTKQGKYARIAFIKQKTPLEELCKGLPIAFQKYFEHCRGLGFTDEPDYNHLRKLFRDLFEEKKYVDDGHYDWTDKIPKTKLKKTGKFQLPTQSEHRRRWGESTQLQTSNQNPPKKTTPHITDTTE